jgi:hypothetical protein
MWRLRLAGRLLTNNAPSGLFPPYIDMLFHITKIYVATCSFPRTAHIRRDARKGRKNRIVNFFSRKFLQATKQILKNMVGSTEERQVAQLKEISIIDPNPNKKPKIF